MVAETDRLMGPAEFSRFAGTCAYLAAATGIAYTGVFIAAVRGEDWAGTPSALLLMLTGLLAIPVVAALYERLKAINPGFSLVGLIFGALGAGGSFLHGGFDLAVILNPGRGALPANQADPRGLMTFAATGLAVVLFARLMAADGTIPKLQSTLGYILGALLLIIYVGRLVIFDPNQPILGGSAVAAGLIVGPAWYFKLGSLLKGEAVPQTAKSQAMPEGEPTT